MTGHFVVRDRYTVWALLMARIALSAAFLSAVADRLGGWGPVDLAGVDWGSMARFSEDVKALNPWVPDAAVPPLAWFVTILEAVLAVMLAIGPFVRVAAFASGVLLILFGLAMAVFLGPKLPLNYSVFTAAACAFLVGIVQQRGPDVRRKNAT